MKASVPEISAIIATYGGDSPADLSRSLDSLDAQTRSPEEIIIVNDEGLPPEHQVVIESFEPKDAILRQIEQPSHHGRGGARAKGVEAAKSPVVAILDADDVCNPDRFKIQAEYLAENPEVDALGGYIAEFDENPDVIESVRQVPTDPEILRRKARFRCPMNHQTVAARSEAILKAGNYRDIEYGEDYDLWVRMLSKGCILDNIPRILTKAQTGEGLIDRRGGAQVARDEIALQRKFVEYNYVSRPLAAANLCIRLPVRLFPTQLRSAIYSTILRNTPS